jgi:putative membrane protein insertion efficiency factor
MKIVCSFAAVLAIGFVRLYQVTLRPIMGGQCRFAPTCSEYAIASITKYGALKGTMKSIYRIIRCNPWGGCGYDPP